MADGVNVFSLSLRRKWPRLWTCGRVSVICGTQQIKTNKSMSAWHSRSVRRYHRGENRREARQPTNRGVHCRGFRPRMDDRLHVSCVNMCTRVCGQPAQVRAEACISLISQFRNEVQFVELSEPCSAN